MVDETFDPLNNVEDTDSFMSALPKAKPAVDDDTAAFMETLPKRTPISLAMSYNSAIDRPQGDELAKQMDIADRAGLPAPVVEGNPQAAEHKATLNDWKSYLGSHPRTLKWMSDDVKMRMSIDDVENLTALDTAVTGMKSLLGGVVMQSGMALRGFGDAGDKMGSSVTDTLEAIDLAIKNGGRGTDTGLSAVVDFLRTPMDIPEIVEQNILPQRWMQNVGGMITHLNETFVAPEPGEAEQLGSVNIAGHDIHTANVLEGLGQVIGFIALNRINPNAANAVMTGMGMDIANERMDGEASLSAMVGGGAATLMAERVGLDLLLNRIPPNIRNKFFRGVADIGIGGVIEGTEEVIENLAHDAIVWIQGEDPEWGKGVAEEAITAFMVGAIMRGAVHIGTGGETLLTDLERQARAQARFEQMLDVSRAAASTKLKERNTKLFQDFVDNAQEAGDNPEVHLDINSLTDPLADAGMDVGAVLEQLGLAEDQVKSAALSGDTVAVKLSDLLVTFDEETLQSLVFKHAKVQQDEMTLAEAEDLVTSRNDVALTEALLAKQQDRNAFEAGAETVYTDTLSQLNAAGVPPMQSESAALINRSVAVYFANELGITPEAFYEKYPVKIFRDGVQQGVDEGLSQGGGRRAAVGGERGLNGEWYGGGQFMPSSAYTVKGANKKAPSKPGTGRVIVEPGVWGNVPAGMRAIYPRIDVFTERNESGELEIQKRFLVTNPIHPAVLAHIRAEGGLDELNTLDEMVTRFNEGQRFYDPEKGIDAKPDAEPDAELDDDGPEVLFQERVKPPPKKTIKAYKLFRVDPKRPGELFPLFVDANTPIAQGVWLDAEIGESAGKGKVKSKLGPLAFRPGWHMGDLPLATHIGEGGQPPKYRPANQVWAEVEVAADVDWQEEANARASRYKSDSKATGAKKGDIVPKTAHITDQIPEDGHYRYKTNPNMTGEWVIGGSIKVNRVLSDEEVASINAEAGLADLPRRTPRVLFQSADSAKAEDIKWAKWEPELTSTGKTLGAPEWVNAGKDKVARRKNLVKMRKTLRKYLREGLTGRYWYEESAAAALRITDNVVEAEKFIQLLAIYSPQATVQTNTNFAVRAWNQWKNGVKAEDLKVKTESQDQKAVDVLYNDTPFAGRKTNSFYLNLMHDIIARDPTAIDQLKLEDDLVEALNKPATIDLWMYRAFGYENEQAGDDKGSGKYSFAENETRRISAELNRGLKAGEERWTPHQVQAAIWSSMKARYEIPEVKEKTWKESIKKGLAFLDEHGRRQVPKGAEDARAHRAIWRKHAVAVTTKEATEAAEDTSASFEDFIDQMVETVTWEVIPSGAIGEEIFSAPDDVRAMFTEEATRLLINEDGEDVLAKMLGAPIAWVDPGAGAFEGNVNPNNLSHLLPTKTDSNFSRKEVRAYTRAIQYIFKQDAVPWFRADPRAMLSKSAQAEQKFRVVNARTDAAIRVETLEEANTLAENKNQKTAEEVAKVTALIAKREAALKTTEDPEKRQKLEGLNRKSAEKLERLKEDKFSVRGGKYARGAVLKFDRKLLGADLRKLLHLLESVGLDGFTRTAPDELSLVNFRDDETGVPWTADEAFLDAVAEFGSQYGENAGLQGIEGFWSEGEYGYVHDWKGDPQGRKVSDHGSLAGFPDLQKWLRGRRAAFEELLERYSGDELELRRQDASTARTLFQGPARGQVGAEPASLSRDAGASLRLDRNGRVPLTHWGRAEGLTSLSPDQWGSAAAGAEANRVGPDFRGRTYFGLPGYRVETAVQSNAGNRYFTTVDPAELYDIDQDPDGIMDGLRAEHPGIPDGILSTLYENAIIDAGYRGYWGQHPAGPIAAIFDATDVEQTELHPVHRAQGGRGIAGYDAQGSALEDDSTLYQSAWHGTGEPRPHDRFTTEKIGTGEGAQAYGWGMYFASRKEVAEYYREALSGDGGRRTYIVGDEEITWDRWADYHKELPFHEVADKGFEEGSAAVEAELVSIRANREEAGRIEADAAYLSLREAGMIPDGKDTDATREQYIQNSINIRLENFKRDVEDPMRESLDFIKEKGGVVEKKTGGRLYRVELSPEDWEYLEWDAPVPESEVNAISDALVDLGVAGDLSYEDAREMIVDEYDRQGSDLYWGIAEQLGTPKAASEFLHSIGIRGIKYLDGSSRRRGEGSYNYVIFSDDDVEIKEYWQGREEGPRGSIQLSDDLAEIPNVISLFEGADFSTIIHELGHHWLEVFDAIAADPDAPARLMKDRETIRKWLGNPADPLTRDQHENFADGVELYWRTGKAPGKRLESVFQDVKRWMVEVYQQMTKFIGIYGTPEQKKAFDKKIRPLFDRMFEASADVDEAIRRGDLQLSDVVLEFMEESEQNVYTEQLGKAINFIVADIEDDKRKIAERKQKLDLLKLKRDIEAQVDAEFNDRQDIRTKQSIMGSENALNWETVKRIAPELANKLPKGQNGVTWSKGTLDPDETAEFYGYGSGIEMLEALVELGNISAVKREEVDRRLALRSTEVVDTQERTEDKSHRDEILSFLEIEMRAFARQKGLDPTPRHVLKAAAERIHAETLVQNAMSKGRHLSAERKARGKADKAALAGDFQEALRWKQSEILNHYLYMFARDTENSVASSVKYLKRFEKPGTRKNIDNDYLQMIDQILDAYELRARSNKQIGKIRSLREWISSRSEDEMVVVPEDLLEAARVRHYKELTVDEFRELVDSIRNIDKLGRLKHEIIINQKKREFAALKEEMIGTAMSNNRFHSAALDYGSGAWKKFKTWGKSFFAAHRKMEFLLKQLDGDKDAGIWWTSIFKPLADAENVEHELQEKAYKLIEKAMSVYTEEEIKALDLKTNMDALNITGTRATVLSIALNWGNAGNRTSLVEGHNWSQDQVQAFLEESMSEKDWQFVQAVWDSIHTFWPMIEAQEKRLTGVAPPGVERAPVSTPYGILPGGYYPIVFDHTLNIRSLELVNNQTLRETLQTNSVRATTRHGHTIERQGSGGKPLKLDLGVMMQHINQVTHDLAFREPVINADRILRDNEIAETIKGIAGIEVYNQIQPWIKRIALDEQPSHDPFAAVIGRFRRGATVVNMGYKVTTAIVQPLGFLQSLEVVGARYALKGLMKFYNPAEVREHIAFVREKSVYMRRRATSFDRDVRDTMKTLRGKNDALSTVQEYAFHHIGFLDLGVSMPTWLGAYEKALDQGLDERTAIDLADSAVRMSQSAGGAKDLAGIQGGTEYIRAFTMFYSYFNGLFNLLVRRGVISRREGFTPDTIANVTMSAMYLLVLPVILEAFVTNRVPDDEDDLELWFAKHIAAYPAMTVVGLRDFMNFWVEGYSYNASPAFDAMGQVGFAPGAAIDLATGEGDRVDVKQLTMATGYIFGLPARQFYTTFEHLYSVLNDEEDLSMSELLYRNKY